MGECSDSIGVCGRVRESKVARATVVSRSSHLMARSNLNAPPGDGRSRHRDVFRTCQESNRVVCARPTRSWGVDFRRSTGCGGQPAKYSTLSTGRAWRVRQPPGSLGKDANGGSGQPDCGRGAPTSRGAFLASRSRISLDPPAAHHGVIRSRPRPPSAYDDAVSRAPAASCRQSHSVSFRSDAAVLPPAPVEPGVPVRWRRPPVVA